MAHVLFSPLSWGLGHATRDIPIIRSLIDHHHEVTIAACGNALTVLRHEFPECSFIEFNDYPSPYSTSRFFIPKFIASLPTLSRALADERRTLQHILEKNHYDLIISDNRVGVYSLKIPTIFITHQIHYHFPLLFWPIELSSIVANYFLFDNYSRVIVPDNPPGPTSLAGKLSRPVHRLTDSKVFFSGILSSTPKMDVEQDLDYLVIISGPEPQRTRLEEILTPMLSELDGTTVALLGSPQKTATRSVSDRCTLISYATNHEKTLLMNRAKFVICRSGYSSMMELAELNKRHGLFIPTPGQPEQEYLSTYYEKMGWFHSKSQYTLNLTQDIPLAMKYTGFPAMPTTKGNVVRLYDELLAHYLE
jgi:uncharacterized protein (TIGR00661 family)